MILTCARCGEDYDAGHLCGINDQSIGTIVRAAALLELDEHGNYSAVTVAEFVERIANAVVAKLEARRDA